MPKNAEKRDLSTSACNALIHYGLRQSGQSNTSIRAHSTGGVLPVAYLECDTEDIPGIKLSARMGGSEEEGGLLNPQVISATITVNDPEKRRAIAERLAEVLREKMQKVTDGELELGDIVLADRIDRQSGLTIELNGNDGRTFDRIKETETSSLEKYMEVAEVVRAWVEELVHEEK